MYQRLSLAMKHGSIIMIPKPNSRAVSGVKSAPLTALLFGFEIIVIEGPPAQVRRTQHTKKQVYAIFFNTTD